MRIDWWTLGLQAINFLVLVWLLQRFLYRPVSDAITARQAEAARLTADAAAAKRQAEAAAQAAEAQGAAIAAGRDRLLAEAREAGEAARQRLAEQAKAEAAKLLAEARAAIARDTEAAAETLQRRAATLAAAMAERLLREAPAPLDPFLERLAAEIASLPERTRAALRVGPLEVATATPLAPAEAARCGARIAEALGGAPAAEPRFVADPALLAGLELRGAQAVVRSSWSADLGRIAEELERDDGPLRQAG